MTKEQLEQRVKDLEEKVASLENNHSMIGPNFGKPREMQMVCGPGCRVARGLSRAMRMFNESFIGGSV